MIQDFVLSTEERKAFAERYLKYRHAGNSVREAHRLAAIEAKNAGERSPKYGTLKNWVLKGVPGCPEIDMGKLRFNRKPEEVPAAPEESEVPENVEKSGCDVNLLKLLLKAYRLRSEKTIDDLVDHLLPELWED